jgi:hypothetical protein
MCMEDIRIGRKKITITTVYNSPSPGTQLLAHNVNRVGVRFTTAYTFNAATTSDFCTIGSRSVVAADPTFSGGEVTLTPFENHDLLTIEDNGLCVQDDWFVVTFSIPPIALVISETVLQEQ